MAAETVEFAELPRGDQVRILTAKLDNLTTQLTEARRQLAVARNQAEKIAAMLAEMSGGDQHGQ